MYCELSLKSIVDIFAQKIFDLEFIFLIKILIIFQKLLKALEAFLEYENN